MRFRLRGPLAVAIATMAALAACERKPGSQSSPASAGGIAPVDGGTVVIALPSDLDYANPLVSADRWSQEIDRFLLFLPLLTYGPHLELEPRLARAWEMEGDTAVVLHLRDGVFWHDGVRVTADDALFTIQRARDPRTAFPASAYFEGWTGGEMVDSLTVRFRFRPEAEPLAGLPLLPIVPKHLLDTIPPERMREAAFNHAPVGDGPFRFAAYRPGDRWTFAADTAFPPALGGRPHLDRVVFRVIPEVAAQVTELRTGELDVTMYPPPARFRELSRMPGLRGIVRPSRSAVVVAWNGRRKPLDDPRVRRALTYALDRSTILDVLRAGYGTVARGPIGPYHWAYDSTLAPLPYAPDSARALLAAAGFQDRNGDGVLEGPTGRPLEIELKLPASNSYNRDLAELMRAQLARVGVQLRTRPTDARTFFADITAPDRRFDAALLSYESDFKLDLHDSFHSAALGTPLQIASYRNPEVDTLLDRTAVIPSRSEARPLWYRLQEILRQEQPWTFLYDAPDLVLTRRRLEGAGMDARGVLVNITDWWVARDAR